MDALKWILVYLLYREVGLFFNNEKKRNNFLNNCTQKKLFLFFPDQRRKNRSGFLYSDSFTVVMKNCEPLVLGPALAIERMPGLLCRSSS